MSGVGSAISFRSEGERLWLGCGGGETGGRERGGGEAGVTDPDERPALRLDGG